SKAGPDHPRTRPAMRVGFWTIQHSIDERNSLRAFLDRTVRNKLAACGIAAEDAQAAPMGRPAAKSACSAGCSPATPACSAPGSLRLSCTSMVSRIVRLQSGTLHLVNALLAVAAK